MLHARTRAGDHGHPRTPARAGRLYWPVVESAQQNQCQIGNPIDHRYRFAGATKPTWRFFWSGHCAMPRVHARAGGRGHPRASALARRSVLSISENMQQNPR